MSYPVHKLWVSLAAVLLCGTLIAQEASGGNGGEKDPPAPAPIVFAKPTGPRPTSERSFLRNLVFDQQAIWTSPRGLRLQDATWMAPLTGVTAGLVISDAQFSRHLNNTPSRLNHSRDLSDAGVAALVGIPVALYGWGTITRNEHQRETGLLTAEALTNTFALATLLKYSFGRQRPLEGNQLGQFGRSGASFPSEHAALAWSAASVLAHEYPGPLTQLFAYGTATAVAAARVTGKEHFPSDVLIGSALGWFVGRQVYRAHHQPEVGGSEFGEFVRASERERPAESMGSPYVPLDSWVYGAFDRLAALGFAPTGFMGLRPWTRMECARLVQDATDRLGGDESTQKEARRIEQALRAEFALEEARLGGGANFNLRLDSVYTRVTGISGTPVRDGFHFAQTLTNDYGRPYGEGMNNVTGFTSSATAGQLAFYVNGEYQSAPAAPRFTPAAQTAIQQADILPSSFVPVTPGAVDRVRLLDAYVALNVKNWQLSYGKQSLWWGPGRSGPMMLSTNAAPITMFRVSRGAPFRLPGVLEYLGAIRSEFFIGQLENYELIFGPAGLVGQFGRPLQKQPFIHGQKVSFKPTDNLEFSFSRTTLFAGGPFPLTWGKFKDSVLSTTNVVAGRVDKPGDRRSGLDFSYRLPKLRDWLTFYADGFTDDEFSPVAYWDRSAWTAGLYMPKLPKLPSMDLRAEGVYTDLPIGGAVGHGFFYFNGTWRNGYTNDGNLMGSWIGRQGQGARVWTTYHLTPQSAIEGSFRHHKVSHEFIPQGGSLTDAGVRADWTLSRDLAVNAGIQFERWNIPLLAPVPQRNVATTVQLTWRPRWSWR